MLLWVVWRRSHGVTPEAFALLSVIGFWLAVVGLVVALCGNVAAGGVTFGLAGTAAGIALWAIGRLEAPG